MIIKSCLKDYEVKLFDTLDFLFDLVDGSGNSLYVIDENVFHLYEKHFSTIDDSYRFIITSNEEVKVIDTALLICEKMTGYSAKRNARLVVVGGGVVQDICGFVASILYRGIGWSFVPTTLLSACDSCIGGKTSINYKEYKNLIGTFYPPDEVLICPLFFNSLSEKDYFSGLGEVLKFNLMEGTDGLSSISDDIDRLLKRDAFALKKYVEKSLAYKKRFIEIDEFDRGERIKLNFAHTFGHAIETATEYEIPHGTAVAIGMIMADSISVDRGILQKNFAERCELELKKIIHIDYDFKRMDFDRFLSAIMKDKKQIDTSITAVLLSDGKDNLCIVHDVSIDEVRSAVNHFCDVYY